MLKHLLVLLPLLSPGLLGPLRAYAASPEPLTYATLVTFTPGAALTKVLGFQNTSSTLDVLVHRIEVSGASTMTVTGGLMQYWVYGSTAMTAGGTAAVKTYAYKTALASLPSYVSVSTAPTAVTLESTLPILRPLILNNDEGATDHFSDAWEKESSGAPLLLPAGANRGLIFEQRRVGSSDITDGTVMVRIHYTVR